MSKPVLSHSHMRYLLDLILILLRRRKTADCKRPSPDLDRMSYIQDSTLCGVKVKVCEKDWPTTSAARTILASKKSPHTASCCSPKISDT